MNQLNQQARDQLATLLQSFGITDGGGGPGHHADARKAPDPVFPPAHSNWLGGRLQAGQGADIELLNPATGLPLICYQDAGPDLVDEAVKAAAAGQVLWMALTPSERGRRMWAAAQGLRAHEAALAQLESLVAGKSIRDCRAEAIKVREMFEYYAGWCDKQQGGVILVPSSHLNYVHPLPYGVVWTQDPARAHRVAHQLRAGTDQQYHWCCRYPGPEQSRHNVEKSFSAADGSIR